ncbi:hypothetical protein BDV26DRAFT_219138 [Aspergillus bertholletiae]|uniref:Uncharacterized protein n=1 Tax=Aspergillus bertholletiae TaxID=1226010 RepID=A0A5N7B718_9EURO|nr:hypothetical protein BDV26DRAFT_219138 [Aspergillus bertholletiae]
MFIEHYNHVSKAVPPEQLLEYQVQEGWGPLCRFLAVEEPKEPFPVVHTATQFMGTAVRGWWGCVARGIKNIAAAAAVCLWLLGYGLFRGLGWLLVSVSEIRLRL